MFYNGAAVIGGADGPTAIFVAGKMGSVVLVCCVAGLVVGLAAGLLYRWYRQEKNKKDGHS